MKVPFLDLSLQHAALRTEALAALAATYDANRFCLGKDVEDFERKFGSILGYSRVLGMNSGSSPLHVACMIGGFGPGDEVITTPFTFIATAWGVTYVGARPVFCDIEDGTYNLDPRKLEAAITPRTKALILVHLFGQPGRMDEIMAIAEKHRLFVIEDCAQAVGAHYGGQPVGLRGDCGTFSFYPTKNLGACGEGGAFVSRREDVASRARQVRVHGSDRRYYHEIVGGNFRMDGFQGALLNVKLPHLERWTARRRQIAQRYLDGLKLAGLKLPEQPAYARSVFHQFTVTHPRRDALRAHLQEKAVGTDLIYPVPLHLQNCYRSLGYGPGSFPVAEAAARDCVSLPIFPELTDDQVSHVIAAVNAFPMIDGVLLKACGITSVADAGFAARCGFDYLGFIFFPNSPRYLPLASYAAMAQRLPEGRRVAVTVEPIIEQLKALEAVGFDRFQIHFRHDRPLELVAEWSEAVSPQQLWLAPKLPPGADLPAGLLPLAQTFLLDAYQADKFGGTGKTGDWSLYRRLREAHPDKTWILSGGLSPTNVAHALQATEAGFLDVNSGVESAPGVKDEAKLKAFVEAVHRARTHLRAPAAGA